MSTIYLRLLSVARDPTGPSHISSINLHLSTPTVPFISILRRILHLPITLHGMHLQT